MSEPVMERTTGVAEPYRGARTDLEIHVGRLRGQGLIADYQRGDERLGPFYAGHPYDPGAWKRKADAVRERLTSADRGRVAEAFRTTTTGAARKLERVLAGEGFFVTTGQQAGLFGGPLYTVHKILTAVRLAEEAEALVGAPVVPLFWVAADDHDWAEVNHVTVLDGENELRRIALPAPDDAPPHAMSVRRLGGDVRDAIEDLVGFLPDTPFAREWLEVLRVAYRPDRTVAEAFEDLIVRLFSEFDLAVVSSAHPAVKAASFDVVRREIANASAHAALLRAQTERLGAAGYAGQVTIDDDAANVFLHDEHGRERLVRQGDGWLLRRTRRVIGDEELNALMEADPTRVSPNVLLRPVVESALFPTLAYVGGPSEVAYFAQIGCLFEAHAIEPPIVFPRLAATVIEAKVRRVLDKFGLPPSALYRPFQDLANDIVRAEMPDDVTAALEALRASIRSGYDDLAAAGAAVDPTLRGWIQGNRNSALVQVEKAGKKVASHLRKKNAIALSQLRRAAANVYPDGTPQERVFGVLPYLARYGAGFLPDLAEGMRLSIDQAAPEWSGVRCPG